MGLKEETRPKGPRSHGSLGRQIGSVGATGSKRGQERLGAHLGLKGLVRSMGSRRSRGLLEPWEPVGTRVPNGPSSAARGDENGQGGAGEPRKQSAAT